MPAERGLTRDLVYPVLCLAQDNSVVVAANPERLHSCRALALYRNRYFHHLLLLDGAGHSCRVIGAEPSPPLSPFGRAVVRLLNRRLTVTLQLDDAQVRSLSEAKHLVRAWVDRDPEYWEASRDIEEWRSLVDGAGSIPDLISRFA